MTSTGTSGPVLGVVLAGGRSLRFGTDKAFADLGGLSLVQRAAETLASAADSIGIVANDVERHASSGLPVRPDLVPGIGPLGGLHTAVAWAREEGFRGVVVLATDMPFVPASLLEELILNLDRGVAVVPASCGPRGLEPLCAAYDVGCLPAIVAAVERGDRAAISFLPDIEIRRVDLTRVRKHGDPDLVFFNVNRAEDHRRADELLAGPRADAVAARRETGECGKTMD
jgi:molybdopterin-guanine dinucleotide biosynthesis protein A